MAPTRHQSIPRRVYLRRRIAVALAALVTLCAATYLPLTLLAPLEAVDAAVIQPTSTPAVQPDIVFPGYGAAAIGAVGYPGVLASAGSDSPLPIASISKIVTALVILEKMPLTDGDAGPVITYTDADVDYYRAQVADNGSVEYVYDGLQLTERDSLTVMLLASANNYAESLADWAFGSQTAFVAAATDWLSQAGLDDTTMVEPTGVSPSNASTTADLLDLARLALADPVVSAIVGTASYTVPQLGLLENTNALLGVDGVDGIKTGTLDEAGSCLLFAQDHIVGSTTVTLVGVVLGGPDHETVDESVRSLLAQADAGFQEQRIVTAGQEFASYETVWGQLSTAVATRDLTVVLWASTPVTIAVSTDPVRLASAGEDVGDVDVSIQGATTSVDLELTASINDPGVWWRLTHPQELF